MTTAWWISRSQVTIDDFDLLPAQRTRPFGHRISEELTYLILSYLFFRWIVEGATSNVSTI